jgi:hypothetical protein
MFSDPHLTMMLIAGGAFLSGLIVAKIGGAFARRSKANHPDPRDSRIRSLEAEQRIAQTEIERLTIGLKEQELEVARTRKTVEDKSVAALKQTGVIDTLSRDLKESVKKTRELRNELAERATENVKSQVKLREVETELSVAQASSDMIATGVLDYSLAPSKEHEDKSDTIEEKVEVVKAGT